MGWRVIEIIFLKGKPGFIQNNLIISGEIITKP